MIYRYTDASENYDGFGTKTVEETGYSTKKGPVRLVAIAPEHQYWQEMRYGSGLHLSVDDFDWLEIKDLIAEKTS